MKTNYLDLMKNRRTIYALGKSVELTPDEITELVQNVIKEAPTAFNAQSTRAVLLFNDHHDHLWDLTLNRLRSEVPDEAAFKNTQAKIQSFKEGFATILFYKDTDVVKNLQEMVPLYADNFPYWAEQTAGSSQLSVWTALAENNIGASIQHYNPLIDDEVAKAFNIPANWELRAEMPLGSIEAAAGAKEYMPDEDRFKIFK